MKKQVCVIFGGMSSEYEVSLSTAYSVISNLDREKYDCRMLGITKDGRWYLYDGEPSALPDGSWCGDIAHLTAAYIAPTRGINAIVCENGKKLPIDVIFPAIHGEYAEDGSLQGLLELSGIPFVGSGCKASAAAMDKATTKAIVSLTDVAQARCIVIRKGDNYGSILSEVREKLGFPVFVKPSSAGSSVGVSKVMTADGLVPALEKAALTDTKIIIEEYIRGREVEIAVMGNENAVTSVCGEIDPGAEFYDYKAKYQSDCASYYIPARIGDGLSAQIKKNALTVYSALGCKGLSRVDFFVTDDGRAIFNEINTLPGFTSISMYPKLFMAGGMSYPEIIDRLFALACVGDRTL